ncbi:MAG TPA: DUF3570 domain-containing protein, partial [Polyangiales bacterium]|nr:DUF3570 domain-containing protein [Polyangiales bacterium]
MEVAPRLSFLVSAFALLWPVTASAQQAASAVYVRVDTDHTTVVTPRVSVEAPLGDETSVDVAYSMDVWSSASVDIATSASRPVTEKRDEINLAVTQEFNDAALSAGYRYSYEPDYTSHSASLGLKLDFANKASTLEVGGGISFDDVGRAGDANFSRSLHTYNAQLTFTQVLDASTLLQGVYTLGYSDGYLSSPYRYIGIGSWNGSCGAGVMVGQGGNEFCLPESNPPERLRHAFVLRAARALGDSFSGALAYRFYIDDWDILSHTVLADLHWLPDNDTVFALRYRFYLQSQASHYRARYPYPYTSYLKEYYTRDKELSPFNSHRLALEFERSWALSGAPGETFRTVLSVGPTVYFYSNFIPYERIFAFETTLSAVVVL